MKSHTYIRTHNEFVSNQRSPFVQLTILIALIAVLSLSGCTGLTGAGTPAASSDTAGTLAASATSFNFGGVKVGTNSTQNLTLTNTGKSPVTISNASVTGTGFSLVGGMSAVSIAAGQQRTVQLQFAPATLGSTSGSVAVVSDAANSMLSVSLNGTGMSDLAITAQPTSQSVVSGQTASFSVTATGSGVLTYQWQRNGAAISGAVSPTYTTPITTASDNGTQFSVVISNSSGTVTSAPAALAVTAAPVAPSITSQPASQAVTAGQTATFAVTATGTATLMYQWKKNGTPVAGATSASYTTPATSAADSGAQFAVTVTNNSGSVTSSAAILTVTVPPSIATQPSNQSVNAGQTATFSVSATGSGTLTYQWTKNGNSITGATSATYTTPATAAADNGAVFTVTVGVAGTSASLTSNAAVLTVNVPPSISTQPVSQTVTSGQTATFSVTATGTPTPTYQWKKNGAAISGANSISYTTAATTASDSGALYTVTATNNSGSVTSNAATLTVNVLPTITAQPANQAVTSGQIATFSVTATGTGTLTYQWKKNGTVISGATSSSYTTPATAVADSGALFSVTVTAASGSVTSNSATLTVTAAATAPSITTQPVNQTITAGQTATFNVTAAGTATLAYQWNKNGAAINGATSASYTTPTATTSDSGAKFSVTVTNGSGNVTSNSAILTVNASSLILNASQTTLNFSSVNLGSSAVLPVSFTNGGNSNVTISNVSISGAGFTATGVSSGQIVTPGNTATLSVSFAPSAAGSVSGASVTVTSNAANSPTTITLAATGVQSTAPTVTLNWTASASSVVGYNIYRSTVSGGPYTKQNAMIITTTSYTDSTVQSKQTFYYVVTCVDSTGAESPYSAEVSALIP